jgi:predicted amidohydrolase
MMRFLLRTVLVVCSLSLQCATAAEPSADRPELKISVVQYPIEGNRTVDQIIAKMEAYIAEAAKVGAGCVVFPELITFDAWRVDLIASHAVPSADEIAETRRIALEVTPTFVTKIAELSLRYHIAILAGTTPTIVEGRILNTANMFFGNGSHLAQDKLYPTHWEILAGISKGTELKVFEAAWGRSVILTCFDIEFPDVAAMLAQAEPPEMIFVPSMTESRHGLQRVRWCSQARAVELHSIVVISGTVGKPSKDWEHYGQTAVISPRSAMFDDEPKLGPLNQAFAFTETIDLHKIRESRTATDFYPAADILARGSDEEIDLISVESIAMQATPK